MGTTFKLKPEIREFILAKKKGDPGLSCRKVITLIEEKFQLKISKSSINTIFKEAGLSMPVGRRLEKKRRPFLKLKINLPELIKPAVEQMEITKPQEETPPAVPEPPLEQVKKPLLIEQQEIKDIPKIQEPAPVVEKSVKDEPKVEPPPEEKPPVPEEKPPVPEELIHTPFVDLTFKITPEGVKETQSTGAIILKAADSLLGGINKINEIIRTSLRTISLDYFLKTEALIYSLLLDSVDEVKFASDSPLWPLIRMKFTPNVISTYLYDLQRVTALSSDIAKAISAIFVDVRGIKINLVDGTSLYIDGQFHTVWSIQHLPNFFSGTVDKIKSYADKYFQERSPFILFTAPGHDNPSNEFFDFLFGLDSPDKKSMNVFSLYDNQFKELHRIQLELVKKQNFIFGLWPWQFVQSRKVSKIKDFRPFYFVPLKKEYFIAEVEVLLLQTDGKRSITLQGCAIKANLNEKIRLVVLSNYSTEELNIEFLCNTYLSNWPNMEEAFQDYSRKIELSTYALSAANQGAFDSQALFKDPSQDILTFFKNYLKSLDLFARKNFFPVGYENTDFSTVKEQFYNIKASINWEENYCSVLFEPPEQYAYINDLKYVCSRLNERDVVSSDGKKYWFHC